MASLVFHRSSTGLQLDGFNNTQKSICFVNSDPEMADNKSLRQTKSSSQASVANEKAMSFFVDLSDENLCSPDNCELNQQGKCLPHRLQQRAVLLATSNSLKPSSESRNTRQKATKCKEVLRADKNCTNKAKNFSAQNNDISSMQTTDLHTSLNAGFEKQLKQQTSSHSTTSYNDLPAALSLKSASMTANQCYKMQRPLSVSHRFMSGRKSDLSTSISFTESSHWKKNRRSLKSSIVDVSSTSLVNSSESYTVANPRNAPSIHSITSYAETYDIEGKDSPSGQINSSESRQNIGEVFGVKNLTISRPYRSVHSTKHKNTQQKLGKVFGFDHLLISKKSNHSDLKQARKSETNNNKMVTKPRKRVIGRAAQILKDDKFQRKNKFTEPSDKLTAAENCPAKQTLQAGQRQNDSKKIFETSSQILVSPKPKNNLSVGAYRKADISCISSGRTCIQSMCFKKRNCGRFCGVQQNYTFQMPFARLKQTVDLKSVNGGRKFNCLGNNSSLLQCSDRVASDHFPKVPYCPHNCSVEIGNSLLMSETLMKKSSDKFPKLSLSSGRSIGRQPIREHKLVDRLENTMGRREISMPCIIHKTRRCQDSLVGTENVKSKSKVGINTRTNKLSSLPVIDTRMHQLDDGSLHKNKSNQMPSTTPPSPRCSIGSKTTVTSLEQLSVKLQKKLESIKNKLKCGYKIGSEKDITVKEHNLLVAAMDVACSSLDEVDKHLKDLHRNYIMRN